MSVVLLVLAPMLVGGAELEGVEVKPLRTVTVFEAEEHLNFPWVFHGPGHFLSMNCSIGVHTKTERGMKLASDDDGDTWHAPQEKTAGGMGTLLRDGRAVVVGCWAPKRNEDGSYPVLTHYYAEGGRRHSETVAGTVTLPFDMVPHFHRSIVEMPDGSLLATIYGRQEGHKKYTSALMRTADGGRRWDIPAVIAQSEEIGREGFCEAAMLRLVNGDLLCAMRTGGPLYTTRSTDGGKTWTEPQAVADHGVDPDLLLMRNGMLVLSYGRPNVDLIFSLDGTGQTWTKPFTVYRGPGCHYTSLEEAANGDLMVFFSQSAFGGTPGTGPLNMMRLARLKVTRK